MMRWSAFAVVVGVLLSGCQDSGGSIDTGIKPDKGFGAIVGTVLDEAIRPISGAIVMLSPGNLTATSDEAGVFLFDNVVPGLYVMDATATLYLPAQQAVEVVANRPVQATIKLPLDPDPQPYHMTLIFDGRIEASASIATFAVDDVYEFATGTPSPLCHCTFNFTAAPEVVAITYEAVWTDTAPDATGTGLYYEIYPTNNVTDASIQSAFEPSPILHHFLRNETWDGLDADGEFTARLSGSGFQPNYQQPYQMFITLWYYEPPPETWSFVAGDE